MTRKILAVSAAALMLAGCAQNVNGRYQYQPVVDVKASGKTHDEYLTDLDECQQLAAQRDGTGEAVASAIAGALLGAALGGIVGHAYGAPQHGMAYGAGMGGIAAGAKGAAAGHQNQQSIVQNCLAGRGYRVVGR